MFGMGMMGQKNRQKDEPQTANDVLSQGLGMGSQEEMVSFVDADWKRRQEDRRPFELQWRINIAFIEGNQHVDINPIAGVIEETPKLYWWQEREVFNHIAPIMETRVSKLSRMRPILKCTPGSNAQEDIRSAKVGSQLLKNIYTDNEIRDKLSECVTWMESCGTVFMKNAWNQKLGPVVAKMQNVNEETGETTEEEIREGDLESTIVPPQEIYPDNCYRAGMNAQRSIIHAKAYHVDEIDEIWNVKVSPEEAASMTLQKTMMGMGGLGYGQGGFYFVSARLKEYAIVKEYWARPTKRFPDGCIIIVGGGKLLHFQDSLFYQVGKDNAFDLTFRKLDCIERAGVFFGKSVVERLIPIQRRYNALRNRKAEYLNRAAIGHWLVQQDSVDIDIFEQEAGAPGTITEYKKNASAPTLAQYPALPAAFETEQAALLQEFSMISGVSELSRQSKAPSGVKSGIALSIALEQDDTRLTTTAGNVEQFLVENGKVWLRMNKQLVKGVRTLRSIGRNNIVELIDWTAADIRSDDVVIEGASALAESPAQRRQMVFDLLGTPLFMEGGEITKETRAKIMEIIDLGNWEAIDDDDELHISKAERENKGMEKGMAVNAVPYDDHIIHISRHNKYRLTTDYEELVSQTPQIDMLFQTHVDMHTMALTDQMMQAAQAQQAGPAKEEPGGGGSV